MSDLEGNSEGPFRSLVWSQPRSIIELVGLSRDLISLGCRIAVGSRGGGGRRPPTLKSALLVFPFPPLLPLLRFSPLISSHSPTQSSFHSRPRRSTQTPPPGKRPGTVPAASKGERRMGRAPGGGTNGRRCHETAIRERRGGEWEGSEPRRKGGREGGRRRRESGSQRGPRPLRRKPAAAASSVPFLLATLLFPSEQSAAARRFCIKSVGEWRRHSCRGRSERARDRDKAEDRTSKATRKLPTYRRSHRNNTSKIAVSG